MKHVKSLLALVLTLMLICGMAVVPAAAAEGQLVGDAKLFLPSTGPIKVQYTLTTDGTTTVDGATYAITKVENADNSEIAADDIWKYAQIDAATGALYVSQAAKGKEIFLSATSADYTGSKSVVVSEKVYFYDFEDGAVPSDITTTSNGRLTIMENKGNKYLNVYNGTWGTPNTTLSFEGANFASSHITVDLKFIASNIANTASTHHPYKPFTLNWDKVLVGAGDYNGSKVGNWRITNGWSVVSNSNPAQLNVTRYDYVTKGDYHGYIIPSGTDKSGTFNIVGTYDEATCTFSDFEFVPARFEVLGNSINTTISGVTTSTWFLQDGTETVSNVNLLSAGIGSPIDDLEIYTGVKASATMFDAVKVTGDSKLFLPSSGTIKVQYGMETKAGEAVTEGVTYSVSGDNVASYAQMNPATGELLIDSQAKGKTFTVKAATADAEATMEVTTNATSLSANFEDGTIPSFITNGNNVSVATLNNGNNYAPFKAGSWSNPGNAAVNFANGEFAPQVLSVELKFRSAGMADLSSNSIYNPVTPVQVHYDKSFMGNTYWNDGAHKSWPVYVNLRAANTGEGAAKVLAQDYRNYTIGSEIGAHIDDASRWKTVGTYNYTGTYTRGDVNGYGSSFSDDFSFTNMKLVVKDDKIFVSINGSAFTAEEFVSDVNDIETGEEVSVIGVPITSIKFGTPVDDLEIYSGEKVAGAWTISGDDFLIAPYKSTSATSFNYSATPELPWADQNATVTWGLASNYAGTSIDANGKLTITGDTPTGNITIQAKDANGTVIGEKTLEIFRGQKNTYYWIDNRTFLQDFEKYDVGSKDLDGRMGNGDDDGSLIGESNWNDFLIVPGSNAPSKGVATIVQDGSGNKYISSFGRKWWTSSADGSGLYLDINDNKYTDTTKEQTYLGEYFAGEETVNLEADFMFDGEWVTKMDPVYSTASVITSNSDTFDIFYKKLTDETVGVYLGVVDGVVAETGAPLIAVMPVDTWFSLKLEQNNATKAINVYINGRLVAENVVVTKMTSNLANHQWWIGASVDNIQLYSGSATAAAANTEFKVGNAVQNVGFATEYAVAAGKNVVSVTLGEAAPAGVSSDAKLIIAQYSGDKMVKMTSVPVTVVNGKLYGCAALTAEYAAGDTVKAFLWNWGTLQPVK
ncbi:MAG: hypothetical protein E7403_00130 [Ruminococcaceae bacterium]|nr:hypothetical protein [Oscillospiraceae bacterium]